MPLRTNEALPPCLQTRGAITNLPARAMGGKVEAISQKLSVSALELVHRASTFRVLGGSRKRASRWTPEYVKLLLSPRHSRGITQVYLSVALRPRPRRAAARADGLPAHRACAPRAAGAEPGARHAARRARGDGQPAPGGGGRPGGAGALGGGPHPRPAQLGDRHAGGAHDAVHDAAPPAPHAGPRR